MLAFREVLYSDKIVPAYAYLVGDIGGTNCNFGIFEYESDGKDNTYKLIVSIHFKSQEVTDFTAVVSQLLAHLKTTYGIRIKKACLASAGVVSADRTYSKPTNLTFAIDSNDIIKRTKLSCVFLTNDFEVIGYGLSAISPKDLVLVNQGVVQDTTNKAIIGAGTGLGKCIMYWDKYRDIYVPVASEGGHADLAVQSDIEYELVKFLKIIKQSGCNISWEDVLSGQGIQNIYAFFRCYHVQTKSNKNLIDHGLYPDEIFNSRHLDGHAWNTFELYAKLYGRCAKNFALDSLARSGIYIAGGIAAKNLDLFKQSTFLNEFVNCGKHEELLKHIPVYVITDYNVSLYGAMHYMIVENMCD